MAFALCVLCGCASDDLIIMDERNGQVAFDVNVIGADSMRIDVGNPSTKSTSDDLFLPTSSIELKSGDSTLYANCAESKVIHLHNDTEGSRTRGTDHTSSFYDSFGVYGYFYDNIKTWSVNKSSLTPSASINGISVSKTGSRWLSGAYWPASSQNATFFAYAPFNCLGTSISATSGAPQLTYTVPQDISKQEDLMVSKSTEDISCASNASVPLSFSHALTAIKFKQGTLPSGYSIKQIAISGVYNNAVMSMDTKTWGSHSITSGNSYTTTNINDMMLLLPQTLPADATLSVKVNDGTTDKTFSQSLYGSIWSVGNEVTYQISITKITGSFIFSVEPSTSSIPSTGGSVNVTVKSYYKFSDNTTKNIPWSGTYSVGGQSYSASGNGGTSDAATLNIPANSGFTTHTEALKAKQYGTSGDYYDLSIDENGKMTTANCYVVSGYGYFKIPLVYGNGITNGATNSGCYDGTSYFCNHAGTTLSSANMPWITGHGYDPTTAVVLWSTSTNLISSCSIEGNYLKFTINRDNVRQGNVVIAAKYGSTIVWSWHIWVTDIDWTATITHGSYSFMQMPLGFIDADNIPDSDRDVSFTFTQQTTNTDIPGVVIQLGQEHHYPTRNSSNDALIYEWGRKDPFERKTPTSRVTTGSMSNSITLPNTYYIQAGGWGGAQTTTKLWNTGTQASPKKTIYDPCPRGYMVPTDLAHKSVGLNSTISECEGYLSGDGKDFWQEFGEIGNASGIYTRLSRTTYWSCIKQDNVCGWASIGTEYKVRASTAFGFSVRPCKE